MDKDFQYKKQGGGYVLTKEYVCQIPMPYKYTRSVIERTFNTSMYCRNKNVSGIDITIKENFWWDGSSFSFDTESNMRGSCVHDCGYLAIHVKALPSGCRKYIDKKFISICREDGMSKLRARYFYFSVRAGGWLHC